MSLVTQILQSESVQTHAAAAAVTSALAALGRLVQPKAKVVWGLSHAFLFGIPQTGGGLMTINSRTIFVQNVGRAPAEEIEVHLAGRPEHFQVWPTFAYTTEENPERHFVLKIASLGRREHFTIEMLSSGNNVLPVVTRVRTPHGESKSVAMAPMQVFPRWVGKFFIGTAILSAFFLVQLVIKAIW
jgi:hypothetical protein